MTVQQDVRCCQCFATFFAFGAQIEMHANHHQAFNKELCDTGEQGSEWDGVLDREYIKHRAMKIALKQANKGIPADTKAPAVVAKPVAAS